LSRALLESFPKLRDITFTVDIKAALLDQTSPFESVELDGPAIDFLSELADDLVQPVYMARKIWPTVAGRPRSK
jgi:hypothetical protein